MSELIVRELRLRTVERTSPADADPAAADAAHPLDRHPGAALPGPVERLAAQHSRRRIVRDGLELG